MTDLRQRMKELADTLRMHRHRYYVLDQPTVSDAEYDALEHELRGLEAAHPELADPNSPTLRVGAPPVEAFEKRRHAVPMLSLDNAYIPKDLLIDKKEVDLTNPGNWPPNWDRDLRKWDHGLCRDIEKLMHRISVIYSAELKVDGLSLSLHYQDGRLIRAITRGDGETGEDVTANARTIADIPIQIDKNVPSQIEIRGEAFLSRRRWEELNSQLDRQGLTRFANPRNAASGTLKLLDSREVARRRLSFLPWQVIGEPNHADAMRLLEFWGFNRMPAHTEGDIEEIVRFVHKQAEARLRLPFDTDGVVIKIDDLETQRLLGNTGRAPRWAIAFKYPSTQVTTTVLGITWQVGRSGKLTPVAELEAVEVAGSTVRRATLHNVDELTRLGLKIGHRVFIEKGGEVIPKVVALVSGEEARDLPAPVIPETCPECGGEVGKADDGEAAIRCLNAECPAKLVGRLLHFGGRSALDIEGMGEALAEQMVASGRFQQPWEIFGLLQEPLLGLAYLSGLERMAEKSAQNLMAELEAARVKPLARWIHALGIPNVGEMVSDLLARAFGSFETIWKTDESVFSAIVSVGPEVGKSIREFAESHPDLPDSLGNFGIHPSLGNLPLVPKVSLETWMATLGIPELGPATARRMIKCCGGLDELWSMDEEVILDRMQREKILKKQQRLIPTQISAFFRAHPEVPGQLKSLGVVLSGESEAISSGLPLEGQIAVVTGTLSSMSRSDAENLLLRLGAKVSSSVSSKTSFLLAGEKAGSKFDKARALGVPIRDEDWLINMERAHPPE